MIIGNNDSRGNNLYLVIFDTVHYYVQSNTMSEAINKWKAHVKVRWGDDYDGTEEPESCAHVHDEPVIH